MTRRALWASTGARGGISTFLSVMQDTRLWHEWNVKLIVTHRNGSIVGRMTLFAAGLIRYLAQIVLDRPDVVHIHSAAYGSFVRKALLAWIAKAFGLPVILHMHGADFQKYYDTAGIMQPAIRITLERVSAVIALGDAWAVTLQNIAPQARIIVIPNAVRPAELVRRQRLETVNVVFLGEIGNRKGAFELIEAWPVTLANLANPSGASLVLAGDGEVDRARGRVNELNVDTSVEVSGWLNADEIAGLLSKSDVLVLPSHDEGQPMAILEAMARGLCVVATTVGGVPEMLAGDSGVLVQPNDVEQLAHALANVIRNQDLRVQLGENAYRRVQEIYNIDVISQRVADLYRALVEKE